jgi:hypothetical protein
MMPPPCRLGRPQTAPISGTSDRAALALPARGRVQRHQLLRRLLTNRMRAERATAAPAAQRVPCTPGASNTPVRPTALRHRVQCCECQEWVPSPGSARPLTGSLHVGDLRGAALQSACMAVRANSILGEAAPSGAAGATTSSAPLKCPVARWLHGSAAADRVARSGRELAA